MQWSICVMNFIDLHSSFVTNKIYCKDSHLIIFKTKVISNRNINNVIREPQEKKKVQKAGQLIKIKFYCNRWRTCGAHLFKLFVYLWVTNQEWVCLSILYIIINTIIEMNVSFVFILLYIFFVYDVVGVEQLWRVANIWQ